MVFDRDLCDHGQKHPDPPGFPQKAGETTPQCGTNLSKRTQQAKRSGSLTAKMAGFFVAIPVQLC